MAERRRRDEHARHLATVLAMKYGYQEPLEREQLFTRETWQRVSTDLLEQVGYSQRLNDYGEVLWDRRGTGSIQLLDAKPPESIRIDIVEVNEEK